MQLKSLYQYARDGDINSIRELLSNHPYKAYTKINVLDENKVSALHYAARYNNLEVMKLLIQQGADVDITGDDGLTPLHYAARFKTSSLKSLPQLVSTYLTDSKIRGYLGIKDMYEVVPDTTDDPKSVHKTKFETDTDPDPVIKYLLECGAKVNQQDKYGLTPLHYACMRGNLNATKELLNCRSIDIEAVDDQMLTPLHLACSYGQTECVRCLVVAGANLVCRDERKLSPLHKASALNKPDLVRMLIKCIEDSFGEAGVIDILSHVDVDDNTPLLLAVESGCLQTVKVLLEYGATVNECNSDTMYSLHLACTVGSLEIVKELVNNGADINCKNRKDQSPLHVSSSHNNPHIIEFLLEAGADINARDENNCTPLLLASRKGNTEALKIIVNNGAKVHYVDKEDRTCLYLAALHNRLGCVEALLEFEVTRQLLEVCDRWDNTPLHTAAIKGYFDVADKLIDAGADISSKNEDEQTPLHSAAKHGRHRIVKRILALNKFAVNDEDYQSNTALHLACTNGHYPVVTTLIAGDADIVSRNFVLWTPLDCAAANGWLKCAKLLIEARAPVDPMDKKKSTPLHLAAKFGHDGVAKFLIENGGSVMKRDYSGKNALDLAVIYGHRNVVSAIIESNQWKSALRNEFYNSNGIRETPLRLLIKKFPDLAKVVFDKCIETNIRSQHKGILTKMLSSEDYDLKVTMDYEFLDDSFCLYTGEEDEEDDHTSEVWDENGKLLPYATLYNSSSAMIQLNHPLQIMVNKKRAELLGHPLSKALVRYKWNSFARYVFYFNVLFYVVFLLSITNYIQISPRPYKLSEILDHSKDVNETFAKSLNTSYLANHRDCQYLKENLHLQKSEGIRITQTLIIIQAITWLVKEFLQFLQVKRNYFIWDNLMDIFCYLSGFLLVYDFDDCQTETGLRMDWQWQLGAISVTTSWLNFLSLLRKLPYVGIYVVMFTDVFRTFLKVSVIILLFVMAFSFGFYALLAEQAPFSTGYYAVIKTAVMTVGEMEFDNIFFENNIYGGSTSVPYEFTTFLFFVIFMVIMPILITNLLVGLAVDDIKSVQENAVLQRLALQVEMNLSVENLLPECIRRRFITKTETFYPNKQNNCMSKLLFDNTTLRDITKGLFTEEGETAFDSLTAKQEEIGRKLDTMKSTMKTLHEEMSGMKTVLYGLVAAQGKDDLLET